MQTPFIIGSCWQLVYEIYFLNGNKHFVACSSWSSIVFVVGLYLLALIPKPSYPSSSALKVGTTFLFLSNLAFP